MERWRNPLCRGCNILHIESTKISIGKSREALADAEGGKTKKGT